MGRNSPRRSRTRPLRLERLDLRVCLAADLTGAAQVAGSQSRWHNAESPADVNGDGTVSPVDALAVINALSNHGPHAVPTGEGESGEAIPMIDVNGDSQVTAMDALTVINALIDQAESSAVTESATTATVENADEEAATPEDSSPDESSADSVDSSADPAETTEDMPADEEEAECHRPARPDMLAERFAAKDANQDGTLTADEVTEEQWEQLSRADADASGGVTLEELRSAHPRGPNHRPPGLETRFATWDSNDDGSVTADEVSEEQWERLSSADADASGGVSLEELLAFRPERPAGGHGPPPRPSLEEVFAEWDANADGSLTAEEVPERAWDRISAADANDDGMISLEELTASRPQRPHPRPEVPEGAALRPMVRPTMGRMPMTSMRLRGRG